MHRDVPDSRELRAKAVNLVLDPQVFLCGVTAAWLYGVDLHPRSEPLPSLWVACHNGRRVRDRPGWQLKEITIATNELCVVQGVRVTNPLRTAFDCARWLSFVDAVVVVDKLAHDGLIRLDDVAAYAERQRRIRGRRRVAEVVEWADARAASPPESRLRVWLRREGFVVEPQYAVRDETGRPLAYIDLAFVAEKLAIEYQGAHHGAIGAEDERRRTMLRELGWEVLYVYASDLATDFARRGLMFRIRAELHRRRTAR